MADEQQSTEPNEVSRRDFVSLSVAAGLAAAAGATGNAQTKVMETDVQVPTPDGTCDAAFIHPASGKHPAVIIWPDAFGLRPSMRDMGKRLAADGFSVLVVNPYYRVTKAPGINAEGFSFQNQANMAELRKLMGGIGSRRPDLAARPGGPAIGPLLTVDCKHRAQVRGGPTIARLPETGRPPHRDDPEPLTPGTGDVDPARIVAKGRVSEVA